MDWGLLAGGISQGLNQAQQGINAGTIQGEQVRAGRAGEGLQQQHLGLQQQQLTNNLAQQAFQRYIQQENLGLNRRQLESQDAYHRGMLGLHGGELGVKQAEAARKAAMFPYEVDETKAKTGYYNYRPEYLKGTLFERGRTNDIREQRNADLAMEADRRLAIMDKRAKAYIERTPQMTPFQRARMAEFQTKLRDLRYAVSIASKREADGLAPIAGQPSLQQLMSQLHDIEAQQEEFVTTMPGAPEGAGGPRAPMTLEDATKAIEAIWRTGKR